MIIVKVPCVSDTDTEILAGARAGGFEGGCDVSFSFQTSLDNMFP